MSLKMTGENHTRHHPRWKCMNCSMFVESSNKDIKTCPNCFVTGTLIKDID